MAISWALRLLRDLQGILEIGEARFVGQVSLVPLMVIIAIMGASVFRAGAHLLDHCWRRMLVDFVEQGAVDRLPSG